MATSRARPSRLDLKKRHVTQLTFSALREWSERYTDQYQFLDDQHDDFIFTSYASRGNSYNLSAGIIRRTLNEEDGIFISVTYEVVPPQETVYQKDSKGEAEFWERVEVLQEEGFVRCSVQFEFESIDDTKLWFPLPSRVGGSTHSPELYEIRGVRGALVPLENAADGYEFTLDRPEGTDVYLSVVFWLRVPVTTSLGTLVLSRAVEIAARLTGA